MDLFPGARVDRYVLLEPLGEGGQAAVWKAEDPLSAGNLRAVKLLAVGSARRDDAERVRREARALARLAHPSLIACHALFEDLRYGVLGIVMDYVDALSLAEARHDPRFSSEHVRHALAHIAGALSYVHDQGVTHRDLKLENVLVHRSFFDEPTLPEHIKLVDFGIATPVGNPNPLTALDSVVGTLPYLAPELIDPAHFVGSTSAPAVDAFAFGVLAYRLLYDDHPTGLGPKATIVELATIYRSQAKAQDVWPPRQNEPWSSLLRGCLALDARTRIQHGNELARHTTSILRGEPLEPSSGSESVRAAMSLARTAPHPAFSDASARGLAPTTAFAARAEPPPSVPAPPPAAPSRTYETSVSAAPSTATSPSAHHPFDPIPRRRPRSALALLTASGIVVAAGLAYTAWTGTRVRGETPEPISLAAAGPSSAAVTRLVPDDEANDARAAATLMLPAGCDPALPLCRCCRSGQSCGTESCEHPLGSERYWLRLGDVELAQKTLIHEHPDALVCASLGYERAPRTCTRLRSLKDGGIPIEYLEVTGAALARHGLSLDLTGPDSPVPIAILRFAKPVTRRALCDGLVVDELVEGEGVDRVLYFLDEPSILPERCAEEERNDAGP